MNRIDHVLYGVHDLDKAATWARREYGWGVLPGGSPAPGLRNAVVPLAAPLYLELITVTDPAASPGAARLAERLAEGEGLFTWAVEPDDLDTQARRLGLTPSDSDADTGNWRILGEVQRARPFFIEYGSRREKRTPGWQRSYDEAAHDNPPGGFTFVAGNADLAAWLDEVDVPLRVAEELAVGIASERGEIVLS